MCWDRVIEAESKQPEKARELRPVKKDAPQAPTTSEPPQPRVAEDVPALAEARS